MKNTKRGITLIALVITVIILLILAGVTLNMVLGENGILRHAKYATEEYENKAKEEENALAQAEYYMANSRETGNNTNYSPEEQVIGKWINGKTLYRKVIVFEDLTYASDFIGPLNIKDIDTICRAEVYHSYKNGKAIESARYGNSSYYFSWYISGENVYIQNKITNINEFDYIVIVEYTKN